MTKKTEIVIQILKFMAINKDEACDVYHQFTIKPSIESQDLLNILNEMNSNGLISEGATAAFRGEKVVVDWRITQKGLRLLEEAI